MYFCKKYVLLISCISHKMWNILIRLSLNVIIKTGLVSNLNSLLPAVLANFWMVEWITNNFKITSLGWSDMHWEKSIMSSWTRQDILKIIQLCNQPTQIFCRHDLVRPTENKETIYKLIWIPSDHSFAILRIAVSEQKIALFIYKF